MRLLNTIKGRWRKKLNPGKKYVVSKEVVYTYHEWKKKNKSFSIYNRRYALKTRSVKINSFSSWSYWFRYWCDIWSPFLHYRRYHIPSHKNNLHEYINGSSWWNWFDWLIEWEPPILPRNKIHTQYRDKSRFDWFDSRTSTRVYLWALYYCIIWAFLNLQVYNFNSFLFYFIIFIWLCRWIPYYLERRKKRKYVILRKQKVFALYFFSGFYYFSYHLVIFLLLGLYPNLFYLIFIFIWLSRLIPHLLDRKKNEDFYFNRKIRRSKRFYYGPANRWVFEKIVWRRRRLYIKRIKKIDPSFVYNPRRRDFYNSMERGRNFFLWCALHYKQKPPQRYRGIKYKKKYKL